MDIKRWRVMWPLMTTAALHGPEKYSCTHSQASHTNDEVLEKEVGFSSLSKTAWHALTAPKLSLSRLSAGF